ncbi:uncharacterized protein LOC9632420 isoform X1 [Selaginella moellendorffii]|uniref:uncharacterized protein LOC9632420 isoform X1 n=1 Tax=Selaginella moellendorffii TaxID=88036 RepID=UPI000D1C68D2|nr:uncharacterized protein LOC9632420 isoform X1 [Selaginella moellendorffii]|eukprot:XP_024521248.1 uncharacterized protein LOC9632420 isoform X1 [Selaginella moellendorffii]
MEGATAVAFPFLRCGGIVLSPRATFRPRACSLESVDGSGSKKKEQLLAAIKGECGKLLCAMSLLSAGLAASLAGEHRGHACFARISGELQTSTRISFAAAESQELEHENKNVLDVRASDGAENMSEEMRRAYEQWKTVPYSISFPLRIVGLRGSVPPVWIKDFMVSQGKQMKLGAEFLGSLDTIYTQLVSAKNSGQLTSKSTMAADVVTLGDSWLGVAIRNKLIASVGKPQELEWFQHLDPKWQAILRRDAQGRPDETGQVWGAPYRCGCMVIAYRKDKLAKAGLQDIKDWDDLWKPELAGRISMIESTREVVGLVLKSLGASYNARNLDAEVHGGQEAVKERFLRLRKQVRVFDNINYLRALGAGDVWIAVGWSNDVLPFAKRQSNVGVIAPASGTSLWADVWAIPAAIKIKSDKAGGRIRGPSPLVSQWLEFCLQPARSLAFHQEAFCGASPLRFADVADNGSSEPAGPRLDTNLVSGLPPKDILGKSEFLEPLEEETLAKYRWLLEAE